MQRTRAAEAAGADDIDCQQAEKVERGSLEREREHPNPHPILPRPNRCPSLPPVFLGMPQDAGFLKWATFPATYVLFLDSNLLLLHGIFLLLLLLFPSGPFLNTSVILVLVRGGLWGLYFELLHAHYF